MAFTFDPALADPVSQVRQRLGDTDGTAVLVQDETILAYLATLSPLRTAARLARDIAARFARVVSSKGDQQETTASDLFKHFSELAVVLEREAAAEIAQATPVQGITVGGTTRGDDDYALNCWDRPVGPWGWQ